MINNAAHFLKCEIFEYDVCLWLKNVCHGFWIIKFQIKTYLSKPSTHYVKPIDIEVLTSYLNVLGDQSEVEVNSGLSGTEPCMIISLTIAVELEIPQIRVICTLSEQGLYIHTNYKMYSIFNQGNILLSCKFVDEH